MLLLADCSIESALFQGLLTFAEDAVQAGVLGKLKSGSSKLVERGSSHILDNGTPAWRDSIEAAFDLCDKDGGGIITADEAIHAVTKYPLIAQLLHVPVDLDDEGRAIGHGAGDEAKTATGALVATGLDPDLPGRGRHRGRHAL